MPVKVTEDDNLLPISIDAFAEGVDYAISAEPDIISMSLGGQKNQTMINLLEQAHKDSIVLIAASGNNGSSDTTWPAGMEEVIAVGSTTHGDTVSDFSNYGTWLDLMAPGDSIYSTMWEGSTNSSIYGKQAGTSMACPLVSGVASLMMAADTSATPSDIRSCLKQGCKNIDSINPGYIDSMGAGRVNAYQSLLCLNPDLKDSAYTDTASAIFEHRAETSEEVRIHPNPAQERVLWETSKGLSIRTVEVIGLDGKVLKRLDISDETHRGSIELNSLSKGLYMMRFQGKNGATKIRKLSVVR